MTEQDERDMIARQLDALIAITEAFLSAEAFASQLALPAPFSESDRPIYETWRQAS